MKKTFLTFGLILGVLLCINMFFMVNICTHHPDFKGNELIGYAAMVVVSSMSFFGIRNYRNKELGGIITFGQAFKTGALTALVGSTMYVVVWMIYFHFFVPNFMDMYTAHVLRNTTPADLPAATKSLAEMKELYKNPLYIILLTYAEVLPVGLIVALVSALILKRKPKTTAN